MLDNVALAAWNWIYLFIPHSCFPVNLLLVVLSYSDSRDLQEVMADKYPSSYKSWGRGNVTFVKLISKF